MTIIITRNTTIIIIIRSTQWNVSWRCRKCTFRPLTKLWKFRRFRCMKW